MKLLIELFLTFAKIGLFTFGGGYAMIPVVEDTCVDKKGWITHDEMMNITVIAESTPGPIAINAATYVGLRRGGLPGAIAATLGVILPSFIIIYAISMFLEDFLEIAIISNAFKGIKIGVGFLILDAGINMALKVSRDAMAVGIMAAGFGALLIVDIFSLNVSSIAILLAAGIISFAMYFIRGRRQR